MRRIALVAAIAAVAAFGFAPAASAVVKACASATATVNGNTVVNEAHCVEA